jgi:phospholipid/cholesterol/gamma-HCH transport system substrate-binding protein
VAGTLIQERLRWRGSTLVQFRTGNATGIWPGVNVTLSGYRIGQVEAVELASDGQVDVRLRIASPYRRLVGPQSRGTAIQEGVIGDTVVALTPDITPPGDALPPPQLTIGFEPSSSPADLLSDLAETRLQLDRTLQAIAAVVEKDLPTVTGQVDGTLEDVRRLAGTLEREAGATAAATRDTLRLYQQTGEAVETASSEATEVMKTTSPVLVDTLQQVSAASATTNRLLKGLAGTFLFDGLETEPADPPQPDAAE